MTPEERTTQQESRKVAVAAYAEATRVFSLRLLCVAAPLGYAAILLGSLRLASGPGVGLMFGGSGKVPFEPTATGGRVGGPWERVNTSVKPFGGVSC